MVGIGIVGIGFMGMTHFRAIRKVKGAGVTAVCTRSEQKLKGDWRGIRGNFGDPGEFEDLSLVGTYGSFDDLLADRRVDLVDVCLPTSDHASYVIRALQAGKHVLVEKPISLSLRDADRMIHEAEKAGQLLMVAHVLPFFPEYTFLAEAIRSEKYGKLLGAHFKRIISKPDWSADLSSMERSGGPGVDLHIHDTHFITAFCGKPDRISASGRLVDSRYAEYLATIYRYDNRPDLAITCTGGAISKKGRPFAHGFEAYFDEATVLYEFITMGGQPHLAQPLCVLTHEGNIQSPNLGSKDPVEAFVREIQAAVKGVNSGSVCSELSSEVARTALSLCFNEVKAVQASRSVNI
ncbi:MAG: Gfo/Idh/MocA family oxidoreductase [Candidatus Latescibacterota bacterium]|nr:Gfo/Idh/MocA family oxidoreductase [Candidatus Latescibacterota bacterium]